MQHDAAVHMLRQRGYRLTSQRRAVLQVVSSSEHNLTAEEIYTAVVPQQPALDIATVYRTLQWLQTVGLIAALASSDGRLRYEYHPHGNEHHHLICQVCGRTVQVPADDVLALRVRLRQTYAFVLDEHLALPGACAECASRRETGDGGGGQPEG
jgi:Fur family transcriptional regulator, ferric uptake regulator